MNTKNSSFTPADLAINSSFIRSELAHVCPVNIIGTVTEVCGPVVRARMDGTGIGDIVAIETRSEKNNKIRLLQARVVAYKDNVFSLSPFGAPTDVLPGAKVHVSGHAPRIHLSPKLLGTVVDPLGEILAINTTRHASPPKLDIPPCTGDVQSPPPNAFERAPINKVFATGVRAIDGLISLGVGSRLAVFAEPGVGKSTLLGMIANNSDAQIIVVGLIGERGREVRDFLERTLAPDVRARTVCVMSTSSDPPVCRVMAAHTATRIAEYFRDAGMSVLLEIDSLTRLLRAYRELGLAAGELPVRKGYPPSAFSELPQLIERAGVNQHGSITALYTALLSSDLEEDPMVEELRGLTDGHILLRKSIAESGRYPAIDVLGSLSRLQSQVVDENHKHNARIVRRALACLAEEEDTVLLGGEPSENYKKALRVKDRLQNFLAQNSNSKVDLSNTTKHLDELTKTLEM